ncbi:MAG: ATP-binding protein [Ignavibacterium sp.]|jgi:signal transduction histidine kinase|nr:ATP-binding protein [Ignavibacterium sp.]
MQINLEKYFKSTRFKTTLWYSIIFLLLEIVLGTIIYIFVNQTMREELDTSLTKQAESIYSFVRESEVNLSEFESDSIYSSPDELVYDIIFEALAFNPNNTYVQVSIKDKVIFRTANLGNNYFKAQPLSDTLSLINYNDTTLSVYPIRAAYLDKNNYMIIAAFPLETISKTLDNLESLYIIIAPVFLFLSFAGGAFLSFKALARIDKIIKRTDEIDTFNLDTLLDGENYADEYGRLVKTLNRMLTRIKGSFEYMNQFAISASHELKTPLTILRGELELALKSSKSKEQYHEIIKSSYEETLRLINIVERLFFITKLDNSIIQLNKTKINLIELITDLIEGFGSIAEEKHLNIILEFPHKNNIVINADADLIRQVLINLIDNAIKYSLENSSVLIKCDKNKNDAVYFSITNKSEPVSKEIIPKLFDRFYRAEISRNRNLGGVGLGLSVVKHIIDLHSFNIKIESDEQGYFTAVVMF